MILLCALAGILAGALVNWCADGPAFSHRFPRPVCAFCGCVRPGYGPIAVWGYLRCKPRCPCCGAPLPARQPLVELGLALLFALLLYRCESTSSLIVCCVFTAILALVSVIDFEQGVVPNSIIYPAWLLALLGNLVYSPSGSLPSCILGGLSAFALLVVVHLGGRVYVWLLGRVRQDPLPHTAFGLGDVRLGAFAGLVLGVPLIFPALLAGIAFGGGVALVCAVRCVLIQKRRVAWLAIPYGPCLAAGAWLVLWLSCGAGGWLRGT